MKLKSKQSSRDFETAFDKTQSSIMNFKNIVNKSNKLILTIKKCKRKMKQNIRKPD